MNETSFVKIIDFSDKHKSVPNGITHERKHNTRQTYLTHAPWSPYPFSFWPCTCCILNGKNGLCLVQRWKIKMKKIKLEKWGEGKNITSEIVAINLVASLLAECQPDGISTAHANNLLNSLLNQSLHNPKLKNENIRLVLIDFLANKIFKDTLKTRCS